MKTIHKFACLALLAALVFVPLGSVSAKGLLDGQVIFGQEYTLKSGETLEGDLVVVGGSAVIETGAEVQGNVVLVGGTMSIDGEVNGEVAIVGGSITLGAQSHIGSSLTTVGATLTRVDGSQVDGQINNAGTSWEGETNGTTTLPIEEDDTPNRNINFDFMPLTNIFNTFWQAVGMAALAMVVALFLAPQAGRIARTVTDQPLIAGGLGLLTMIVAPLAVVVLSVTIILIPVAVVAILVLIVAGVFGWIAIGYELGMRFTKAIHQEWHPALAAGAGTFALSLVTAALTGIPVLNCVGWFAPFLLSMAALGAVIMTRFGTQAAAVKNKATVLTTPEDPGSTN